MATIRKRGPFSWEVQVRKKGYPPQVRTFINRADAEAWAKEIEVGIQRGLFFDRTAAERTTVGALIERYRSEVLPSKRGRHFRHCLDAIEAEFGSFAVATINSQTIATWRDQALRQGLSASTVRKRLNTFSKLLDIGSREWGVPIATNPIKQVTKPPERNARERRLTPTEAQWLPVGADLAENIQLRPLIDLALETGARLGELLSVEWNDVDLRARVLTIRGLSGEGSKNGEVRRVPLSSAAVEVFKALPRGIGASRVFFSWSCCEATRIIWQKTLKRSRAAYIQHCEERKLEAEDGVFENLRFHDLRHEAASRLAEKLQAHELAKVMGWRTIQMAMRYYHPRAEDLARKIG